MPIAVPTHLTSNDSSDAISNRTSSLNQSVESSVDVADEMAVRSFCMGLLPLKARLEPWMVRAVQSESLHEWVEQNGSPLNLLNVDPMRRNVGELQRAASDAEVDLRVFFARKANKCLSFVDLANEKGWGVDTASENELKQCLQRGVAPANLICTAAVKSETLIRLCLNEEVCIAVDNHDELNRIADVAMKCACRSTVAIRLGGFEHKEKKLPTRFGFDVDRDRNLPFELGSLPVDVEGVHFHLDGYDADQRVSALATAMDWIERLQDAGHEPTFIDMGGGVPMRYLDEESQWLEFWQQHRAAMLGKSEPLTYRGHGLGTMVVDGRLVGTPKVYPFYQSLIRGPWLSKILNARLGDDSVAERLKSLSLQLRCEPGRSVLDGCGMTVARVEYRKQNADGDWLVGVSMNRTQCRTSSEDFLVDPLVVPSSKDASRIADETDCTIEGYLVGAYCTESELLCLRKLRFPGGIRVGDLVVFPNTAGYMMHFLESRSHQFPLAKNLVLSGEIAAAELDLIDQKPD
ncbi:Y4yA family PLP-dependent enzyme [Rhodopirellula halodulae]|uniref:Y4yA family PLP-dependent enzyme n=1 Tax=Rhodopirellula halodulae TaxID=2894198 RepID=UPI001E5D5719|nr:Y4yA family PLP-dependent enzyme [Rhodopirellula sp. JC737]MCC9658396.1 Y4yA family PLP-dependent enzyme [Rhodopirellula sp. JC737]